MERSSDRNSDLTENFDKKLWRNIEFLEII